MEDRFAEARTAYLAGRYTETLEILNGMIGKGDDERPLMLLAETFAKMGMPAEAAEAFQQAAARGGVYAPVSLRRAAELCFAAGDDDQAQLIALKLWQVTPDDPTVAFVLASLFMKSGEWELVDAVKNTLVGSDKIEHLRLAIQLIGDDVRNENNLTLFSKMRALVPQDAFLRQSLLGFAREFCDFAVLEQEETALKAEIAAGHAEALTAEPPHYNIMWCADERLNRLALNIRNGVPISAETTRRRRAEPHAWGDRIRIGYVSADFWDDHATMRLLQSVLTAHDPARFDVTLFCFTPDRFVGFDGGNRRTWGRIVPIGTMTDAEAEAEIRSRHIDILVDLKGNTAGSRPALFNRMAAPVQVAWLGFPGTGINIDCDYIIGDPIVLPDSSKPHYHEKFCRLPESYQPNDPVHRPLPAAASRSDLGLPADAFVFAAFNATRKISLATIDLWIRLLWETPGSLLWLMCDSPGARTRIAARLAAAGLGDDRLIFAPKTDYASHIARLQAADLAIDTFPCNGHTTTSDTLWAGVPVVTARGSNFASRVSESLLRAIGLPELVADGHDGFVALAAALANDRPRLARIRETLVANRFVAPLFDAERFCRHLESGYRIMADRAQRRLAPEHFDVPAEPPRRQSFRPGAALEPGVPA